MCPPFLHRLTHLSKHVCVMTSQKSLAIGCTQRIFQRRGGYFRVLKISAVPTGQKFNVFDLENSVLEGLSRPTRVLRLKALEVVESSGELHSILVIPLVLRSFISWPLDLLEAVSKIQTIALIFRRALFYKITSCFSFSCQLDPSNLWHLLWTLHFSSCLENYWGLLPMDLRILSCPLLGLCILIWWCLPLLRS